ncbi:MAG: SRPBCC family protein [Woeseiaceae bacterium]
MPDEESYSRYQWPVGAEKMIAAPAQEVWMAISTPGNLEVCHPFCSSNPVGIWPGPASQDEVHYLSGWVYERRFLHWHDGIGYDLEIGRCGGGRSYVSWRITPVDKNRCVLSITVYPHVLQNWPTVVRWIPHLLRLRPMLKKYLESVVKGFEWYVVRGERVSRDQFGRHPWFSAP